MFEPRNEGVSKLAHPQLLWSLLYSSCPNKEDYLKAAISA